MMKPWSFPKQRHFCICQEGVENCSLKGKTDSTNLFSKIEDLLEDGEPKYSGIHKPTKCPTATSTGDPTSQTWSWKKREFTGNTHRKLVFYYTLCYDASGERVREHDKFLRAKKGPDEEETYSIRDERELTLVILGLFGKNYDHQFVEVFTATGLGEFKLVVDKLSLVERKDRSSIYFGFLTNDSLTKSKRAAIKKIEGCRDTAQKEIELAIETGGRYNMKYYACTEVTEKPVCWVAMELCCMETLEHWVELKTKDKQAYLIGHDRMKICFRQILLGLINLHSKGICHGELTMQNILLSSPEGDHLKIGDYDHGKQSISTALDENDVTRLQNEDILMTTNLFFKCLNRDVNPDTKPSDKELSDWLSSLKGDIENEMELLVSKLLTVLFHTKPPKVQFDQQVGLPPTWTGMLKVLASEKFMPKVAEEKDRYMSAYLLMHMITDRPKAKEILQHPFFWNELKILDFIARLGGCFYLLKESEPMYTDEISHVIKKIEGAFRVALESMQSDLNWLKDLEELSEEYCGKLVKQKIWSEYRQEVKGTSKCRYAKLKNLISHMNGLWPNEINSKIEELWKEFLTNMEKFKPVSAEKIYEKNGIKRYLTNALNDERTKSLVKDNFKEMEEVAKDLCQTIAEEAANTKLNNLSQELDFSKVQGFLQYLEKERSIEISPEVKKAVDEFWGRPPTCENDDENDIHKFMRLIRNTYAHYHQPIDPNKKKNPSLNKCQFDSAAGVWRCFGNVLPEMICILHRAVWLERENRYLPDDIRQFFKDPNNADTLDFLKLDRLNKMGLRE